MTAGSIPPPPAARTPRADVRRRVLDAAAAEFTERGYAEASLATIARRAGFTKGAVYSNFESKQTLLADVLLERAAPVIESALGRLTTGRAGVETLAARAGAVLADQVAAAAPWHALTAELALQAGRDPVAADAYRRFRTAQRAVLVDTLSRRSAALGLPPGTALDHAALVLLAVLNGLALEHAADPTALDGAAMSAVLTQVLAGLIETAGNRPGGEPA
jgi:AcrR family transcriptional regulator